MGGHLQSKTFSGVFSFSPMLACFLFLLLFLLTTKPFMFFNLVSTTTSTLKISLPGWYGLIFGKGWIVPWLLHQQCWCSKGFHFHIFQEKHNANKKIVLHHIQEQMLLQNFFSWTVWGNISWCWISDKCILWIFCQKQGWLFCHILKAKPLQCS